MVGHCHKLLYRLEVETRENLGYLGLHRLVYNVTSNKEFCLQQGKSQELRAKNSKGKKKKPNTCKITPSIYNTHTTTNHTKYIHKKGIYVMVPFVHLIYIRYKIQASLQVLGICQNKVSSESSSSPATGSRMGQQTKEIIQYLYYQKPLRRS